MSEDLVQIYSFSYWYISL